MQLQPNPDEPIIVVNGTVEFGADSVIELEPTRFNVSASPDGLLVALVRATNIVGQPQLVLIAEVDATAAAAQRQMRRRSDAQCAELVALPLISSTGSSATLAARFQFVPVDEPACRDGATSDGGSDGGGVEPGSTVFYIIIAVAAACCLLIVVLAVIFGLFIVGGAAWALVQGPALLQEKQVASAAARVAASNPSNP